MFVAVLMNMSACAMANTPASTSTPTEDPNAAAYEDFAEASMGIGDVLSTANSSGREDLRTKWDEIGLRAEGDVKERVEALVNEWSGTEFNQATDGVDEAEDCLADTE